MLYYAVSAGGYLDYLDYPEEAVAFVRVDNDGDMSLITVRHQVEAIATLIEAEILEMADEVVKFRNSVLAQVETLENTRKSDEFEDDFEDELDDPEDPDVD